MSDAAAVAVMAEGGENIQTLTLPQTEVTNLELWGKEGEDHASAQSRSPGTAVQLKSPTGDFGYLGWMSLFKRYDLGADGRVVAPEILYPIAEKIVVSVHGFELVGQQVLTARGLYTPRVRMRRRYGVG